MRSKAAALLALVAVLIGLLTVGADRVVRYTRVPVVHGLMLGRAKAKIKRAHLKVGKITYVVRARVRVGAVQSVKPRARERVRWGTKVSLVVRKRATVKHPTRGIPSQPPPQGPHPGVPPAPPSQLPPLPTVGRPPSIIGVGNVPGCNSGADPTPWLRRYHASALRIIIDHEWSGDTGGQLQCMATATREGYKILLVFQSDHFWSLNQTVAWFRRMMQTYSPHLSTTIDPPGMTPQIWAVGIENEPELTHFGDVMTAGQYSAEWKAVAPMVRRYNPRALLVAGSVSPWGLPFLKQAYADGLPGAQVAAGHPYQTHNVFSIPDFVSWARSKALKTWFTEAMSGPQAWGGAATLPASKMLGAQAAFAWLKK